MLFNYQKITRLQYLPVLVSICIYFLPSQIVAQGEIGGYVGVANYQGDLASYNFDDGFKIKTGIVLGFHAGYELSNHFKLRSDLLYARISGDDALQSKEENRSRNLSFAAPVIQFGLGADWNIFKFSGSQSGAFTPYLSAGASIFYFNPRTTYEGKKVSLQPLGTEGQFLDDYPDQKPYSRFQPSLQFGGGLKYVTDDNIILALEGMISYTFTDYLDDASTIYISYPELLEKAGGLTAALANRQGEYFGTDPVVVPTGSARANPGSNDLFGTLVFKISIPVDIGKEKFKVRQNNNKTIPNPKF